VNWDVQMRSMRLLRNLIFCTSLMGMILACSPENSPADPKDAVQVDSSSPQTGLTPTVIPTSTIPIVDIRPRSWYTYAYFDWEHDGYPFGSEHFWVYSDSASMRIKEQFAMDAERALERILPIFEEAAQEAGEVRFLYPKMEIFISSKHFGEVYWQGFAYFGGFLVVFDQEYFSNYTLQFPDHFPCSYVVAHELTHVLSARLAGYRENDIYHNPHAWFDEGLATYLGRHPVPIRTLQMYELAMEEVANRSEQGNPIYIRYSPLPGYPENLYELAVYYLIETYGMERVIGVYIDLRSGDSFEIAFENRIGMTVDQYQENFDALIREYFQGLEN
jgi:hypothetical protein